MSTVQSSGDPASVAAEYFAREDDRFIEALRRVFHADRLAELVDRWKQDTRPWARLQVFAYLEQPLNVPGHHVVVKRLFKWAETARDHEQMAAFAAAFDRLTRRVRKTRRRYEWIQSTRQMLVHETEYLGSPRDSILPPQPRRGRNPRTGKPIELPPPPPYFIPQFRLFSGRTRRYLQRRAWRYFRRLGFQQPGDYVSAVASMLLRFRDADLARPENLLDSWSFLHACFGKHPAVEFAASRAMVAAGRSLSELEAAPYFEPLWAAESAATKIWSLLFDARSRAVRLWARQLLERHHRHAFASMPVETLLRLLTHDDVELQQFGATLLSTLSGIDQWPVAAWLELLEVDDPTALAIVCDEFARRVKSDRLALDQTLDLAVTRATPVARIGLSFLRVQRWDLAEDRRRLTKLGNARCEALGGELAKFAIEIVGAPPNYDRDVVVALFDSLLEPVRTVVLAWFRGSAAAQDDPVLWSRVIETPFDDVRLPIIDLLTHRAARPRIDAQDLRPLWTAVLLSVHRGGRQKLRAIEQLVTAVVDVPARGATLLPVLAVAVRSIRGPEQRAGLAGIARLIEYVPDLAPMIGQAIPELSVPVDLSTSANPS